MAQLTTCELQPTDIPFLFVTLVAARNSGDKVLETLARDWLTAQGVCVRFTARYPPVTAGRSQKSDAKTNRR